MSATVITHSCLESIKFLIQKYKKLIALSRKRTNDHIEKVAKEYKLKLKEVLDNFQEKDLMEINIHTSSTILNEISCRQKTLKEYGDKEIYTYIRKFEKELLYIINPECKYKIIPQTNDKIVQIFGNLNTYITQYTKEIIQIRENTKKLLQDVLKQYRERLENSILSTKLQKILDCISERQRKIKLLSKKAVEHKIVEFKEELEKYLGVFPILDIKYKGVKIIVNSNGLIYKAETNQYAGRWNFKKNRPKWVNRTVLGYNKIIK